MFQFRGKSQPVVIAYCRLIRSLWVAKCLKLTQSWHFSTFIYLIVVQILAFLYHSPLCVCWLAWSDWSICWPLLMGFWWFLSMYHPFVSLIRTLFPLSLLCCTQCVSIDWSSFLLSILFNSFYFLENRSIVHCGIIYFHWFPITSLWLSKIEFKFFFIKKCNKFF